MRQLIFNRNENPYGPSQAVVRALRTFSGTDLSMYIPGYYRSLVIPYLARRFQLPEDQVLLGYGIEDFLQTAFVSLRPRNASILTHQPYYGYYQTLAERLGVRFATFPLLIRQDRFLFSFAAFASAYRKERPALVLLASPNNPSGNTIAVPALRRILRLVSPRCLVLMDEAYYGFDSAYDALAMLSLVRHHPNFLIVRTFSKYYGLAGLRMCYALAGTNGKKFLRTETRFLGFSRVHEQLALAALTSGQYYEQRVRQIRATRAWLLRYAQRLVHVRPLLSAANFVSFRVPEGWQPRIVRQTQQLPTELGKFITPTLLRVTIGKRAAVQAYARALQRADRKAR